MLVFCLLAPSHRVEPICARAYCCILDFWRFIHSHPHRIQQCVELLRLPQLPKHSLLGQVSDALHLFHLGFTPMLDLVYAGNHIPILHVGVRDIKPLLQNLAVQYCYEQAGKQSRKDLSKPQGLLDLSLFKTFYAMYTKPYTKELDLTCHFESQSVGCTVTNDRRCAAGYTESNACRYCNSSTESLAHLVIDCPGPKPLIEPPCHEFGPNFRLLGLFEHPVAVGKHRTSYMPILEENDSPFLPDADRSEVWTDGSVYFTSNFWLTVAGYSIVSAQGEVLEADRILFPNLSSYAAELYAATRAFVSASTNISIYTDCKSIVDQFAELQLHQLVPSTWSHRFWWLIILRTWRCRTSFSDCPLQLIWVPSHVGDNLENADITEEIAARHGTTVRSIILNKVADKAAKTAASHAAAIHPQMWNATRDAVYQRQLFLSRWNFHIGFNPSAPATADDEPATSLDPLEAMKKRFGRWDWIQNASAFSWSSTAKIDCSQGWFKKLRPDDVDTFFRFMHSLHWRVDDSAKTAYVELAFLFWKRGFFCMRFLQPMVPFVTLFFGSDEWSSSSTKHPSMLFFQASHAMLPSKQRGVHFHKAPSMAPSPDFPLMNCLILVSF